MADRPALRALAADQGGAFTVAQARRHGWTDADVARDVRAGRWLRLGHGVCVEAELWFAMDARAKHLCQVRARLLVLRPGWVAARRSALLAHRLPYVGKAPTRPQLLSPPPRPDARASSRHERLARLDPHEVAAVDGLPVTSLVRTVLDVARGEGFRSGVVAADAVLRRGVPPYQLQEAARRVARWPGGCHAVRVAGFADGRAESPLESVSRVAVAESGVPVPELQVEVWVGARRVARVDALWRAQHVVGEADGRAKYQAVEDLYAEKRRQDALEELGLVVVRWSWQDAWRPRGVLDVRLQRALARGSGTVLDPRVRFMTSAVPRAA